MFQLTKKSLLVTRKHILCVLFLLVIISLFVSHNFNHDISSQPTLYIITATYSRYVQIAELTRLCNTFRNLNNILWIVVEDGENITAGVADLLKECGVPFVHLNVVTPTAEKPTIHEPYWFRPKGIQQRNLGLLWLRQNLNIGKQKGVLYIADDDNSYNIEIFKEIRQTKRVSTWPVGLSGELPWEGCVTSSEDRSQISYMWAVYKPERPFPIDMAGFAVNIDLILTHPNAKFDYNHPRGMQESHFLMNLGLKHWSELEPMADGCRKILVWHTRTAEPLLAMWKKLQSQRILFPTMKNWP